MPEDEQAQMRAVESMLGAKFTENSLSEEQQRVFKHVVSWFRSLRENEPEILTLGGFAGTGKTTLLCALADHLEDKNVAFCSLTGKAVNVLKQKFAQNNVRSPSHEISTIHKLLYFPETDSSGRVVGWSKKHSLDFDLIVIDEGSMVSEQILKDFLDFRVPIFAVGDHGQLPPIEGQYNLMGEPDLLLEHIHRQAKGSPVLALSEQIRETGLLPSSYKNSLEVQFLQRSQVGDVLTSLYNTPGFDLDDLALLCFSNKTRTMLNELAREIRWGKGTQTPRIGDQIICLKNAHNAIFNGMRGEIMHMSSTTDAHHFSTVDFRDERLRFTGALNRHQFNRDRVFKDLQEFANESHLVAYSWKQLGLLTDYGYALTVHKSQGSEFKYVILVDDFPWDRFNDHDFYRRWVYTGVSRCRKFLVVLR